MRAVAYPASVDGTRLNRIPALDGLRAVAVLAVLGYHAGISWLPGGMLGVDVFFVISGFLITGLLVTEHDRTGSIALGAFWARRARRLLPALAAVLLFVAVVWGWLLTTPTPGLRGDLAATAGYFANWRYALNGQGYFSAFSAPSPLLHTWSLAVEEQFYLLWPLLVLAAVRTRLRTRLGQAIAALAVLAAAATAAESLAGVWTDRLYYGTDTRAVSLLAGAAAGVWYARRPADSAAVRPAKGRLLELAALAALAALSAAFAVLPGQSAVLYRGGFALLAVIVACFIASLAVHRHGPANGLLTLRPLRYLGVISYGLYLWHWPLFLLITHARTGLTGVGLLAVRMTVSVTVAAASYRLIEQPVRTRRLRLPHPGVTVPAVVTGLAAVMLAVTVTPAAAPAPPSQLIAAAPAAFGAVGTDPVPVPAASTGRSAAPAGPTRLLVVGDSVAYSLAASLQASQAAHPGRWPLTITNAGLFGCGISLGSPRRFRGQTSNDPFFCAGWPRLRAEEVAQYRPQVVAVLVGEWELMDRWRDGRWQHIGEPGYDAYLARQLDLLIGVVSGGGARVKLLTATCHPVEESPNGDPYPESTPGRVAEFNVLLRAAAARHKAVASVIDLHALVCPGGRYVATYGGLPLRLADGIHFVTSAIPLLADTLLPELRVP